MRTASAFIVVTAFVGWVVACSSETPTPARSGCAVCSVDEQCIAGRCVPLQSEAGPDARSDAAADAGGSDADSEAGSCIGSPGSPTVGKRCGCNSDCEATEVCGTEAETGFPGGRCIRSCSMSNCPDGSTCTELVQGDPSTKTCLLDCEDSSDCPLGSNCAPTLASSQASCVPFCASDSECAGPESCDLYTHLCGDFGTKPGPGKIGAECTKDGECIGGICNRGPKGGACSALCTLDRPSCPEDAICSLGGSAPAGDLGVCFKTCDSIADCGTGQACGQYPDTPVKVCGPAA